MRAQYDILLLGGDSVETSALEALFGRCEGPRFVVSTAQSVAAFHGLHVPHVLVVGSCAIDATMDALAGHPILKTVPMVVILDKDDPELVCSLASRGAGYVLPKEVLAPKTLSVALLTVARREGFTDPPPSVEPVVPERAEMSDEEAAKLRIVAGLSRALADATALEIPALLEVAAQHMTTGFADGCFIRIRGNGHQRVIVHRNQDAQTFAREVLSPSQLPGSLADDAIARGIPIFLPRIAPELAARFSPDLREYFRRFGAHSLVVVPVRRGTSVVGALGLLRDLDPSPFKEGDIDFAHVCAEHVSLALDQARLVSELAAREANYRALVENSTEGIWRFQIDPGINLELPVVDQVAAMLSSGYLIDCNNAFARMHGYESALYMVGCPLDLVLSTDHPDSTEYLAEFVRSHFRSTQVESFVRGPDGKERYFSNDLSGVFRGGKLVGAWGTRRDVTELKSHEAILARSAQLDQFGRDVVLFVETDTGRVVGANEAAVHAYGYAREDLLRKSVYQLRGNRSKDIVAVQLAEASEHGAIFETEHQRADGTFFPVEVISRRDSSGSRVVMSVVRDVTERKRTEELLHRTSTSLRTLSDASADLMYVKDRDGRLLFANPAKLNVLGKHEDEVIGRTDIEILGDAMGRPIVEHDASVIASGMAIAVEETVNGRTFVSTKTPYRDKSGSIAGIIGVSRDISDRKKVDHPLFDSEDRLLAALEAGQVYAFELQLDSDIVTRTLNCASILGIDGSEATISTSTAHLSRVHPDDVAALEAIVKSLTVKSPSYRTSYRYQRGDGQVVWLEEYGTGMFGSDSQLVSVRGLTVNVTARVEAEQAIREREERLRLAANAAGFGTYVIQLPRMDLDWSPEAKRIAGLAPDTKMSMDLIRRFLHPEDRERVLGKLLASIGPRGPDEIEDEHRLVRADGSVRWVFIKGRTFYDGTGPTRTPVRATGAILDITERKLFGVEREADELRKRFLLDLNAELVVLVEPEELIARATRRLGEQLGVARVVLNEVDLRAGELITHEAYDTRARPPRFERIPFGRFGRVITEAKAGNTVVVTDTRVDPRTAPLADAIYKELGVAASVIAPVHRGGEWLAALVAHNEQPRIWTPQEVRLVREVADLVWPLYENARLLRIAQEAVRLRDEFLSIASHELRTPITAMNLQLEQLRRLFSRNINDVSTERIRSKTDRALRQVDRLSLLVDSLLDVSRIAAGRLVLDLEEFDLRKTVRDVVVGFGESAARARSEITFEAKHPVVGRWDRMRIEQVISSLLSNAVKYGSNKPIRLFLKPHEDVVVLEVQDEGIGISADDAARIFERFGRAEPIANYGGMGLGLYISKQIVEAHGGRIQVESHRGEGAVFRVVLPRLVARSVARAHTVEVPS